MACAHSQDLQDSLGSSETAGHGYSLTVSPGSSPFLALSLSAVMGVQLALSCDRILPLCCSLNWLQYHQHPFLPVSIQWPSGLLKVMHGPLSSPCPGPPGEPVSLQLTIGALPPTGLVGHSSIPCVTWMT